MVTPIQRKIQLVLFDFDGTLVDTAPDLIRAAIDDSNRLGELVKQAVDKRVSFVSAVLAAGVVKPADLAHTLSATLALPLIDLNAVDLQEEVPAAYYGKYDYSSHRNEQPSQPTCMKPHSVPPSTENIAPFVQRIGCSSRDARRSE